MKLSYNINLRKFPVIIAILTLLFLVVIPLFLICTYSIYNSGSFHLNSFISTIISTEIASTFINTLILGFLVVVVSSIIAVPMAFLVFKTDVKFKKVIDVLMLVPFMIPPYIESMGWILFMQKRGYLEQLLPSLTFITPYFFTLAGLVIIMSLHIFPFMYLSIKNSLIKINLNLEEASFVHGANFSYTLRKIIFPLLFSSYAVGALIIFLRTVSEFGAPATFGRKIGYYVLTTEIYKYVSNWPIDFEKASTISLLLTGSCLILWYFQSLISSKYSYPLLGGKGSKIHLYKLTTPGKFITWIYISIVFILSIGIPLLAVILTSIIKIKGSGLVSGNFTLSYYIDLFSKNSAASNALLNTFVISLLASVLTAALGVFYGLLIGKKKGNIFHKLIDVFSILPNTVPGIVLVLGLIIFFNNPNMPIPIYNTYGMVILTYIVLFLPYTVQYVSNSYVQINSSLEEAGAIFGGNSFFILRKIILPLILKAVLSGFIMTFIISVRELVASLMILPPAMQNSASFIYSQFEQGSESSGMAMAVVSIIITIILLILLNTISNTKKES